MTALAGGGGIKYMHATSQLTKLFLYTYTDVHMYWGAAMHMLIFDQCRLWVYNTYKIVKLTVHVRHLLLMAVHLYAIGARARSLFIMTSEYCEMIEFRNTIA